MTDRRRFLRTTALAGLCAGALPGAVRAAAGAGAEPAFPGKPIRVVVPFTPGGGADIVARVILQHAGPKLGQPFVVDNRAGGSGIIGTEAVAKAPPDGYTLLMGQTGPNAINPALYAKLPYDAIKDFAPITLTTAYPYVAVVAPSLNVDSLQALAALVSAKPGTLAFGSAGVGSSTHLAALLYLGRARLSMIHAAYKGTSAALADVAGGQIAMMFADITSASALIRSGRLRALAVTGSQRSRLFPDVPTVAEAAGLPGFEASAWHGFLAPAGTPAPIVHTLHEALVGALTSPEVRGRFAQDGIEVVGNTPEQFAGFLREEIGKWGAVVKEAGITPE
ncbi:tripartite tricarboxylate transporter substrate binding protein [Pigmentiphaga soli]|uniref:Tripartite tricarboxylate transporter substrate binding protein n=1 Tax=Pigmentiphaga soli TaxID=1007095 RepID=A0ABP8HF95_9BURK